MAHAASDIASQLINLVYSFRFVVEYFAPFECCCGCCWVYVYQRRHGACEKCMYVYVLRDDIVFCPIQQ